jgi:hypothetical protein
MINDFREELEGQIEGMEEKLESLEERMINFKPSSNPAR